MSVMSFIEARVAVAMALDEGQCGGSYIDACILISSIVSGIAAKLWPGKGIDYKRFVELWVQYTDPDLAPTMISIPLLSRDLREKGNFDAANKIEAARPGMFGAGGACRVVTGIDVDFSEAEVQSICPQISLRDIRTYSYPAIFYREVRSSLVHEYNIGPSAHALPMTNRDTNVSYVNQLDSTVPSRLPRRRIHYHMPWLALVVRSLAEKSINHFDQTISKPASWWLS